MRLTSKNKLHLLCASSYKVELVLAFIHSFRNMLLRSYSMPEILICQRRGNLKRQNVCTLMMIFQASDEQAFRREPWITSHHVHNAFCSSTKAQLCFPLLLPCCSQANFPNQPSLLNLVSEIDPYESSSSFICTVLCHFIVELF